MDSVGMIIIMTLVKILGVMIAIGWIPALIARSKGRNFVLWWIYGGPLFFVALFHSLFLTPDEKVREQYPDKPDQRTAFSAINRIFHAPRSVFHEIKQGMDWFPALIILVLLAVIVAVADMPAQKELAQASAQITIGEAVPEVIAESADEPVYSGTSILSTVIKTLLATPFFGLLIAFFFWLGLTISYGGVPFGRIFTLAIYVHFITFLGQVVDSVYNAIVKPEILSLSDMMNYGLNTSIGLLIPTEPGSFGASFLTIFLRGINIFSIWHLILFVLGSAVILSRPWKSTLWPVLIVWLLSTMFMSALFAGLMSLATSLS